MKINLLPMVFLLLLSLLGTLGGNELLAQSDGARTERTFDEATWEELQGELDYSGEAPEKKEIKESNRPELPDFPTLPFFWQVVSLLVMLVALSVFVYRLLLRNERSTKIITASDIDEPDLINIEELEENLDKNEVLPFLLEAERAGNYHLAVRLHYLALLKKLNEDGAINWKKELTNRAYLRQMRSHVHYADFQTLTGTYERIWYGNHFPTLAEYEPISQAFLAFPSAADAEKADAHG